MVRLCHILWRETGEGVSQGPSPELTVDHKGPPEGGDQLSTVGVVVLFNSSARGEDQGPDGRLFQIRAAEATETPLGKTRDQEGLKSQGAVRA